MINANLIKANGKAMRNKENGAEATEGACGSQRVHAFKQARNVCDRVRTESGQPCLRSRTHGIISTRAVGGRTNITS